ncbi:MAG: hypothetical protein IKI77_11020 [Oscillospiraceae bacterium]|nr:hypothetical protein [Oscillospiraceae bacterium]
MQNSFKESRAALLNRTDHILKEIKEKGKSVYDKSKPYISRFVRYAFQGLVAYGVKELLDHCLDENSNEKISEVIDAETYDSEPVFFQALDEPKRSYNAHTPSWQRNGCYVKLQDGHKMSEKARTLSIQYTGEEPPANMTFRKPHPAHHHDYSF